jgi:hypothetical protein
VTPRELQGRVRCEPRKSILDRADIATLVPVNAFTPRLAQIRTDRIDHQQVHLLQVIVLLKQVEIDGEIEWALAVAIFDRLYDVNPAAVGASSNKAGYDRVGRIIFRGQDDDVTSLPVGGASRPVATSRHCCRDINCDLRLSEAWVAH